GAGGGRARRLADPAWHERRVHEGADPDRQDDDVAPAWIPRPPLVQRIDDERDSQGDEDRERDHERDDTDRAEPTARVDLRRDGGLEALEALAHRRAVVLDPLTERREPLAAALEHMVDHTRDLGLPRLEVLAGLWAGGDVEACELLLVQPAPGRALGRRRLRRVDVPPDQVEERRRELERAGCAALREQSRDECRGGVGRRLLLVLAVV